MDLAVEYVRVQALLIAPIAPHVAEHLYCTVLGNSISIQQAQYPTISQPVEEEVIESAVYLRKIVKDIRDTEMSHQKKKKKGKYVGALDLDKPTTVRVITSTAFPEWQSKCIAIVKECWNVTTGALDEVKIKELIGKAGLAKEKRAMPMVASLRVSSLLDSFVYRHCIGY